MKFQRIATQNRTGWTSSGLNEIAEQFVEACEPGMQVMEIGAAYGVAALAALERGAHVVANDLDPAHLAELARRCSAPERLTLLPGRFPRFVRWPGETLDAILASNVLHFLTGPQLVKAVASFAYWLKPGGAVYIVAATPYLAPFAEFLPEYGERVARGVPFPGWVENARKYSRHGLLSQIPKSVHLLDVPVLEQLFAGWQIDGCRLFRRRDLSKTLWLDGREAVGLVARKSG
ncbi:MAG: class I SAM-dependent methyltransferase [Bryobacter sp.]|nr:class I SAM-dependent methyltransferase [Bryobacter sp.]